MTKIRKAGTSNNALTQGEMASDASTVESTGDYAVIRLVRKDGEALLIGLTADQVQGLIESLKSLITYEYGSTECAFCGADHDENLHLMADGTVR